jgi:signal peptidase I
VLILNGNEVPEPYLNPVVRPDARSPDFQWQQDFLTAEIDPSTYFPSLHNWGPLVISPDHYFMLGDNRDESLDSRYWGLLEGWRFEGRVALVYFSYNKGSFRPFPAIREIRWGRLGRTIAAVSEGSTSAY